MAMPVNIRPFKEAGGGFARLEEEQESGSHVASPEPSDQPLPSQRRFQKVLGSKGVGGVADLLRPRKFEPEEQRRAALKIQRWYRELVAMYAAFGPMMFSCKDGRMADFGTVSYLSGSRKARFIRVADTTSGKRDWWCAL